jgi:hypothetical protein
MHPEIETPQVISRRKLLRILGTTGGSLVVSAFMPSQWVKPLIEVGYLPAHAQSSTISPTPRATSTTQPSPTTTRPAPTVFILSNTTRTLTSLNGCSGPNNSVGSLFQIKLDYKNSNGAMSQAAKITQRTHFSPSGREANSTITNFTLTGDGFKGSVSYTVCTGFGTDTQATTTIIITDSNGMTSNEVAQTVDKPLGANEISPTSYEEQ